MRGTLFGLLGGDQAITDSVYNMTLSRAANLLIFVCSLNARGRV